MSAGAPAPGRGRGRIAPEVAAEFPGLALAWQAVPARLGASPAPVRERLRELADRWTGARVVAMRTQPLARAYRSFFRQIGLDPDVSRVPSEGVAVRRLLEGGLHSRDLLTDALTVAVLETGVPVWALDGAAVTPDGLGIRLAQAGEALAAETLAQDELVVADAVAPLARLFGAVAAPFAPRPDTRSVILFAVGVDGVPPIFLEEALWLAEEVLGAG